MCCSLVESIEICTSRHSVKSAAWCAMVSLHRACISLVCFLLTLLILAFSVLETTLPSKEYEQCIIEWDRRWHPSLFPSTPANNLYSLISELPPELVSELSFVAAPHDMDVSPNTVLWYVGGNTECEVGRQIQRRHNLQRMYVFEPVPMYFASLENIFKNEKGVVVLNYGLDAFDRVLRVPIGGKATTATQKCIRDSECTSIEIRSVMPSLRALGWSPSDSHIMYLNCEGCEYGVLKSLLDHNVAQYFEYIHFATHAVGVPSLVPTVCQIRQRLNVTHFPLFAVPFAQERWRRRQKHATLQN